ncbi:hypothetical protein [Microviridae sp.]|nr:hypothetical protein [Microviridae sp.]
MAREYKVKVYSCTTENEFTNKYEDIESKGGLILSVLVLSLSSFVIIFKQRVNNP